MRLNFLNYIKTILIIVVAFFMLSVQALPWDEYKFQDITSEIKTKINKVKEDPSWVGNYTENQSTVVFGPVDDPKNNNRYDDYIINNKNQYIYAENIFNLEKFKQTSGEVDNLEGFMDEKLIFENGNRYGQYCLVQPISGTEICAYSVYIDFTTGRVTYPTSISPAILTHHQGAIGSNNGLIAFIEADDADPYNSCVLRIGKMFSKKDKYITLNFKQKLIDRVSLIGENKAKLLMKDFHNKKWGKSYEKTISIDTSKLE